MLGFKFQTLGVLEKCLIHSDTNPDTVGPCFYSLHVYARGGTCACVLMCIHAYMYAHMFVGVHACGYTYLQEIAVDTEGLPCIVSTLCIEAVSH